ncbi:HMP-PP hydrolase (pyridoxal phosphatase) Cof [Heyndrickxia coagulans]|jgi:Cof subfamily protein (haloacid dehalogenase superfamily)|uniref:Cof-like hydrolase n=3 Tax=Heyndrickxia TaxID=2837504 RepID=A0A0C5C6B6_HEYCO|nr:Cof-type HAD-IIB family hydrolase [Heyndrickxia coagulans]AEP00594.1 Cof-like hydrolase [Heyndrickxia coagulans 36D1]AJO20935.1 Cof-like hydrolase [Heyndrickxia coagulans]AKN53419.1 HMP-PP hydrolase (pyridoxal phosphatase) Cof [Heyndrickxia coagulans]KWZ77313.1 Cof-like hydrolase [Heyndrickxia coagulans]UZH05406.1 Cof-type HAD-IIB family hydrolase [Heyndrickxia coagulans]
MRNKKNQHHIYLEGIDIMIECIASDMDGTLLNSRQEVSPANAEAIKLAQKKGIHFVVTTGRSYEEARLVLDPVGIDCTVIGLNGAEVRDEKGKLLKTSGLDPLTASQVADVFDQLGIYYEFFTNKGTYTEDYEENMDMLVNLFHTANPEVPVEEVRNYIEQRGIRRYVHNIRDTKDIFHDPSILFYKILAFNEDEQRLRQIGKHLEKDFPDIKVTSSGFRNIEINHVSAQKGIALKEYTEKHGLSMEKTMAIGDNLNDISMLERVGYPFAMGNAENEVLEICRYRTKRNDEDGVAKAIYRMLEMG